MFHISGVLTAAFDTQLEWLIVKGIADFADGEQVNAESWEACASAMAASLVSHILSDPGIFRYWPNYSGINSCQLIKWVMIKRGDYRQNLLSLKENMNPLREKVKQLRS